MNYRYLSVEVAVDAVRRFNIISEYNPAVGSAKCPMCGEWGNRIYNCVKKMKSGKLRRYFVCPTCGHKYGAE